MSLFDSASLVVTPNGYKEDKLYSIKPTDGSGDLVVTRATTATRVNSAGLVELVPYNLQSYSEDFSNAVWFKVNTTISSNSTTAPDGNTTADKLIPNTSTDNHAVVPSSLIINNSLATATIYAKAAGYNFIGLSDAVTGQAVFNLSNGTIVSQDSGITAATPINVGDGWYRLQINFNATTSRGIGIDIWSDASKTIFAGNGTSGIYVWGAQLVSGTSAKEYFPTTDRLDISRLDYTNSTCPSILVEPQRTNKYPYSEQFNNAFWLKNGLTVTADNAIAPDGTNTADRIQDTIGTNQEHIFNYLMSFTSGVQYTASFYVKNIDINYFCIKFMTNAFGSVKDVIFNVQNGTITRQDAGITASIVNMGNGWYRCIATCTATVTTSTLYGLYVGITNSPTSTAYTSTTIKGLHLWGAQLEAGSYATSYIPTVASSVTRNADVISKTGISSLIGQTEGTIFFDGIYGNEIFEIYLFLQKEISTGVNDSIFIRKNGSQISLSVYSESTQQVFISNGTFTVGQRIKIAAAYKNNDFVLYVNGVQIGTDNSGLVPTCGALQFQSYRAEPTNSDFIANKGCKISALWKTRLSNIELATLTTI